VPVANETQEYSSADFVEGVLKLSAGKKRHAVIRRV